ncbi:MAG TPA: long-chain-fatty-acid--CoA ligase [Terracidiphilus sp.]|nr:long-chain-fatty-acid--CoA ligase [Terracidiphilus sp.]
MNVPLTPLRCLRHAEEQFPHKTAVVCDDRRFTYKEFAERAGRLGGALRGLGVEKGDRVAFLSSNCHRLLEAYYGVLEAGAVLLPLNIRLAPKELAYILNDAEAKVVFFESQFLPAVEAVRREALSVESFVLLDAEPQAEWVEDGNYEDLLAGAEVHRRDVMEVEENSLAELFYTSGTSANPKGVMLSHRNIYLHALNTALALGVSGETVNLHTIPLFHANGWGSAHTVTLAGGKHVMIHQFIPAEVFRLVERERVQDCCLVPTMAAALVNSPERSKYDLSSLRRVMIGGAASSPTLVREVEEKLGCTCISGYGLTETSPVLTVSFIKTGMESTGSERYARQAMAGFGIPGAEVRVVDAEENDVPRDGTAVGQVVARGDGVMEGYWRQPEETEHVFRGGWFHTGDLATLDEDGYLLIVDREKDIIVSGGENISSLELERTITAHPGVYEVAVVAVPHEKWGEVPKACVVLKPGQIVTEAELMELCRSCLARYKCPQYIEFLEGLPKTGTGKVLKRELRKGAEAPAG